MTITNAERVEGAIVRLRDAVLNGWAIDTEDGMLCQYCGAEVEPEHGDDNSENVLKGECKYECEHGDDCVVLIAPAVVPVLGEAASTITLCDFLNWYVFQESITGKNTLQQAFEQYLKDKNKAVSA